MSKCNQFIGFFCGNRGDISPCALRRGSTSAYLDSVSYSFLPHIAATAPMSNGDPTSL